MHRRVISDMIYARERRDAQLRDLRERVAVAPMLDDFYRWTLNRAIGRMLGEQNDWQIDVQRDF